MASLRKERLGRLAAALVAVALWQVAASLVGKEMLLASPLSVARRMAGLVAEPDFFPTLLRSAGRISKGFLLAFVLGLVAAVFSGRFRFVETLLHPYVITMKTVPVASFIILALIWFSYKQLTVFITFLIAFPVLYGNVLAGIRSADPKMTEMARLFGMTWPKRLLYIYAPAVKPYLVSASAVAMGMAWKAGVAAEVIGMVDGSVGSKLYEAKIYFSNADLLSWTILIILVSVGLEMLFTLVLKGIYAGLEKL